MLSKEEANELFSWIDNLEIALESLQRGVVDLFATNDSCARRTLLEQVISQRQIWLERPVDELQKLIAIGKEKNICLNTTN
jgi:hypothetical protein